MAWYNGIWDCPISFVNVLYSRHGRHTYGKYLSIGAGIESPLGIPDYLSPDPNIKP